MAPTYLLAMLLVAILPCAMTSLLNAARRLLCAWSRARPRIELDLRLRVGNEKEEGTQRPRVSQRPSSRLTP